MSQKVSNAEWLGIVLAIQTNGVYRHVPPHPHCPHPENSVPNYDPPSPPFPQTARYDAPLAPVEPRADFTSPDAINPFWWTLVLVAGLVCWGAVLCAWKSL